ncbi:hypothetical protein KKF82_05885, partial [Patescibacteria group bacterium]|nr:hypothetical protein [Patescibacteria group bacterium]
MNVKKIKATLLIAVFIISTLAIAIPLSAADELTLNIHMAGGTIQVTSIEPVILEGLTDAQKEAAFDAEPETLVLDTVAFDAQRVPVTIEGTISPTNLGAAWPTCAYVEIGVRPAATKLERNAGVYLIAYNLAAQTEIHLQDYSGGGNEGPAQIIYLDGQNTAFRYEITLTPNTATGVGGSATLRVWVGEDLQTPQPIIPYGYESTWDELHVPIEAELNEDFTTAYLFYSIIADRRGEADQTYSATVGDVEALITFTSAGGFSIDYVTPGNVDYGDVLTVMGSGVTAGSTVNLYWDTVTSAGLLNTTTGLPSGDFECTVKVPSAKFGDHYLWARDMSTGLTTKHGPISVIPKIKLSPTSGLKGDTVIVKGYGFLENSDIIFTDYNELTTAGIDDDKTDALGYFEQTFKVYAETDETYKIKAQDEDDNYDSANFKVGAAITLDKTVGPTGTIVKVDGRGFTKGVTGVKIIAETGIKLDGYPVDTKDSNDITVSTDGKFSAYIVIPSTDVGTYDVTFTDDENEPKTASGEFEIDGETKIKVTPGYGTPGAVVTVKGYNYTQIANVVVTIELHGQTWTTKTNSDGEWSRDITIPPIDIGKTEQVLASDEKNCYATKNVLVALILVQLSETSGPVGSKVSLMGVGFDDTGGGDWNATFGDIGIIGTSGIVKDSTTFSEVFWVPSVAPGTYTITVTDWEREVDVTTEFTVTEPAKLTPKRTQGPNRYNLSIHGENFAELDAVETTWYLYNSTRVWDISDDVEYDGAPVETTEYGNFTGY